MDRARKDGASPQGGKGTDGRGRFGSALGDRGASVQREDDWPAPSLSAMEHVPEHLPRRSIAPLIAIACATFLLVVMAL